jgi:hypothetical protein
MVAQKIGQSKLSSKQIKHKDIHTVAVTTNDATRIKIVAQKSGAKHSSEQVQQVNNENLFHDFILHQTFFQFHFRLMIDYCIRESNYVPMIYSLMSTSHSISTAL